MLYISNAAIVNALLWCRSSRYPTDARLRSVDFRTSAFNGNPLSSIWFRFDFNGNRSKQKALCKCVFVGDFRKFKTRNGRACVIYLRRPIEVVFSLWKFFTSTGCHPIDTHRHHRSIETRRDFSSHSFVLFLFAWLFSLSLCLTPSIEWIWFPEIHYQPPRLIVMQQPDEKVLF